MPCAWGEVHSGNATAELVAAPPAPGRPGTDLDGARTLCLGILKAMRKTPLIAPGNETFHLTLSAGIAELSTGQEPSDLFRKADEALYQAKGAGRDQIVLANRVSTPDHSTASSAN